MASKAGFGSLDIGNAEHCTVWLLAFGAHARAKNWADFDAVEAEGNNLATPQSFKITDNFISMCGLEALKKIQFIVAPRNLVDMKFSEIEAAIKSYIKPKSRLTIAERTKFNQTIQSVNETAQDFLAKLRKNSQYCNFGAFRDCNDPEEEMVRVAFVAGLSNKIVQEKILEKLQTSPDMSVEQLKDFVQQYEEVMRFVENNNSKAEAQTDSEVHHSRPQFNSNKQRSDIPIADWINDCKWCGKSHHRGKCLAYGKTCEQCGKANHFKRVCKSVPRSTRNVSNRRPDEVHHGHMDPDDFGTDVLSCECTEIHSIENKIRIITINDKHISMQEDSGATISVVSSHIWKNMGKPKLRKSIRQLIAYDGHIMKNLGKFTASIELEGKYLLVDLEVIDSKKTFGLLGRDLIRPSVDMGHVATTPVKSDNILPAIKGVKARMDLVKDAKKMFCRARPVPLALEDEIGQELDRLESQGIISKCVDPVDNSSPVVWIRKPSGALRMCVDFKVHINGKIKDESYPMPHTETMFAKLKNAQKFAKIDLTSAYHQIELHEDAKELSVINTTRGLYKIQRLQMGMKNASAIFQRTMEQILADIKGVLIYQDDVLVFGPNTEALEKRLAAVKTRLREKNVTLNESKCIEYADEVTYLGFRISAKGILPDTSLVNAIMQIKTPTTKSEVESFVGLVNFFGRLIPNFAGKIRPINALRRKDVPFVWSADCTEAFESLKKEVSSSPVVQPYHLEKEVTLTTDASKGALAGVLTQDGHPVIYVSRSFSKEESNYSNIEREALAVTWSVMRLKQFLLGRKFVIRTDHQPLVHLFGPKSSIPSGTSSRICKWALHLMAFDFDIQYVRAEDLPHADAISRLRFKRNPPTDEDKRCATLVNAVYFEKALIDPIRIKSELSMSSFLRRILDRVKYGRWSQCSEAEQTFKRYADRLTIENGMLYMGSRVFIPPRLRQTAFEVTHLDQHTGIHSSINRLQLSAWWPGMTRDIERMVANCPECNRLCPKIDHTVDKWPPAKPFERMHMDFGYIKDVGNLLVIVDAASGWIEAFICKDRSSQSVIRCLRTIFCRFGVPEVLVSDNAQEFVSPELNQWVAAQGIRKMESPIYFPRANGLVERAVQTVKKGAAAWKLNKTHIDFNSFLQKLLLHHRCSTYSRGKSPAEIVFGRTIRLPIISSFEQGQPIGFQVATGRSVEPSTYLMTKGTNTSWILRGEDLVMVSNNQISPLANDIRSVRDERPVKVNPEPGLFHPVVDNKSMENNTNPEMKSSPPDFNNKSMECYTSPVNKAATDNSMSVRRSERQRHQTQFYGVNCL